jgi:hypothetical protein
MPPLMNNPGQGGEVHGAGPRPYYWWNGHGSFVNPHHNRNAYQWRVKVGSSQYGFNYHLGQPVAGGQYNANVTLNPAPPNGATCWTVVEWNTVAGGPWYVGTPTSFSYHAQ